MRALYLFKRDLRLEDNRALAYASERHREILPLFVFDPEIIESLKAEGERLYYVVRAVERLSKRIKLYCAYGKTHEVLRDVFRVYKPSHLYTAVSYSWDGVERNKSIKKVCEEFGVEYVEVFENFLVDPREVPQRKVYTPFYKEWIKRVDLGEGKVKEFQVPELSLPQIEQIKPMLKLSDYRHFDPDQCEKRLESFSFESYEDTRNYPAMDGTSKLSPCIRFGILSLRKIFKKAQGKSEQFIKELAWREFWYHIALNFPETKNVEFQEKRRNIAWENREEYIEAFLEGKTGYPIVDAGIRQLKTEKWLHNRVRMILASFLTKVLLVDWRIGEEFFKEHLLDYDQVVNVGNWQWSASVGADPKPFRLFNPILQAQRYDPECKYIKKYLPGLAQVPCHMLHNPISHALPYHKLVVNYYERVNLSKRAYGLTQNQIGDDF
ncbi:MAG: deoxyribodipyrimidine photo-lyase [Aquificaceae bacterium]|nr:DNA photolyase family protein [Aquificaceae bacterium]MDW8423367.1 deoxyribodipyrimidine photo-lyase [Aquificaceae bacterium]